MSQFAAQHMILNWNWILTCLYPTSWNTSCNTFFAYLSSQIKERPVPDYMSDLISAMVTVKRNFGVDHRRPSKDLSKKICVGSAEKQLIKMYLDTRKNTPACWNTLHLLSLLAFIQFELTVAWLLEIYLVCEKCFLRCVLILERKPFIAKSAKWKRSSIRSAIEPQSVLSILSLQSVIMQQSQVLSSNSSGLSLAEKSQLVPLYLIVFTSCLVN